MISSGSCCADMRSLLGCRPARVLGPAADSVGEGQVGIPPRRRSSNRDAPADLGRVVPFSGRKPPAPCLSRFFLFSFSAIHVPEPGRGRGSAQDFRGGTVPPRDVPAPAPGWGVVGNGRWTLRPVRSV